MGNRWEWKGNTWGTVLRTAVGLVVIAEVFAAARAYGQENAPQLIQIWAPSEAIAKAPVPEYAFVTIKPDKSGRPFQRITRDDGYTFIGMNLQFLLQVEYNLIDSQILGAPGWVKSERFEMGIKAEKEVADYLLKLSDDDSNYVRKRMGQKILAERFQLKYHRETKDLPAYVLTIAKGGLKLQEPKAGEAVPEGFKGRRGMMGSPGPGQIAGRMVPFQRLVLNFGQLLGRPVIDKTGLTGVYDFTLKWNPEENVAMMAGPNDSVMPAAPESSAPSFFTAVQEQLGLKLTSQKAPLDVMVIDHVERPTEN